MDPNSRNALSNISQYAVQIQSAREVAMDIDTLDDTSMETRLNRTIKELQARVNEQRQALEQLRSTSYDIAAIEAPSPDLVERLKQLRVVTAAYETLTPREPVLPTADSLLPCVLAARSLDDTIQKFREDITSDDVQLRRLQQRHRNVTRDLRDGDLLHASLQRRIDQLQAQQAAASQKSPHEAARERIDAQRRKRQGYEDETGRIGETLNSFIDQHLASMLAAEELGGPVVGDMPDIDDDTLAAGFSQSGKARKTRTANSQTQDKKRQRRLDEIWGSTDAGEESEERNERTAAGTEVQELIGQLWEALLGSLSTGEYVTLQRDSAAARYLVRARIAHFHPRDARRIRLVDFGRELDD